MLKRLVAERGIETPTADDLIRLDRKRPDKKLSNEDWQSQTDEDARIARMKDGRTGLGYKPEYAVDLDTGAVLAAPVHHAANSPRRRGDTKTLPETLEETKQKLDTVRLSPTVEAPAELVTNKGYHSRDGLKELRDSGWKSRISEPAPPGGKGDIQSWHGDDQARNTVYTNRRRLLSGVAKQAFKLRAEVVERGFALALDRGGMRRTWLRGRDKVQKRFLVHIDGYIIILLRNAQTDGLRPIRPFYGSPSLSTTLIWPSGSSCSPKRNRCQSPAPACSSQRPIAESPITQHADSGLCVIAVTIIARLIDKGLTLLSFPQPLPAGREQPRARR